ncbi:amidase [Rhodococcus sp. G-MC3]|uniref:amidase n=1 Tax=Rhodococcus sp. G-MC3 TaxID=3046209 RepID=UPI0024BAD040|nr:amidase [Rhodococcus sp. G-MC3]MDJ0395812.1 amidase [Rhodococcus sp. G-MC3]
MSQSSRVHSFTDDALGELDATGVAAAIAAGDITAAEGVDAAIARAEMVNGRLNAIQTADFDRARSSARSLGPGVFAGVPTFIKDNTDFAGMPSNQGSLAVDAPAATRNAAFTDQLLSTGLISLGKSTMPEFGFNATTEYESLPPTRNPWNTDYSSGASSGGSAALVAAGVVPIAHANDGGGSIRIPAAACGLVGLKLTRGREIIDAHASGMPVNIVSNGVLTRTVRDTAAFVAQIEQYRNPRGLASVGLVEGPVRRRLRIGVITRSLPGIPLDSDTHAAVSNTTRALADLGHDVRDIGLPLQKKDLLAFQEDFTHYWGLMAFAVQKFGKKTMDSTFDPSRTDALTRGLSRMFLRHFWRTPGAVRRLRKSEAIYHEAFANVDVMVSPVVAHTTPQLGYLSPAHGFDVLMPRLLAYVAFTPLNNASGGPAISLPLESTDGGLPIGVQLSADQGAERLLLELAFELEAAQPFRRIFDAVE